MVVNRRALYIFFLLLWTVSCRRDTTTDYLNRGNDLYARGRYGDAALAYRKAIQKDVRTGDAHYRYALALIALNEPTKAILPLRRALTLMPDHEDSRIRLADIFLNEWFRNPQRPQNEYEEIKSLANRILSLNPKSFGGIRLLGHLALQGGDAKKAVEYFEKADSIRPRHPDVVIALARLRYEADPNKSELMLRDLLKAAPGFAPAYNLLYTQCMMQRRTADAEQVLIAKRQALPKDEETVLQIAGHYAGTGRTAELKPLFDGMLAKPAEFPNAYLRVGDFYAVRKDYDEALRLYRQGADKYVGQRKEYETRIVNLLLSHGKKQQAEQTLESILKRDNNDADARAARASLYLDSGAPELVEKSIRELEAVVKDVPENASFHYMLAKAYLASGNRASARSEARDAVRRDRGLVAARILVAEMELDDKRPKEALGYAVEALQIDPVNPKARVLLSRALQLTGRITEAKAELTLILKDLPEYREAQLQMGYIRLDERKYSEAEATFARLLRTGRDDTDAMTGLVQVYYAQKQPFKALEAVKTELARNPQARQMRFLLADLASRSGNADLALEQYLNLVGSGMNTAALHESISEIYFRKGQFAEAIESLRKAFVLAPGRTDLAVLLAGVIEHAGQSEEARKLYRQALQADPQNVIAMNNLAYNLAESGQNLDEALDLATKASRTSSDPNFADTLGWVYLKKKMNAEAIHVFRNLTQKQPANVTFRLHLGTALLAVGERTTARQELQLALSNNPSAREMIQIRTLLTKIGS